MMYTLIWAKKSKNLSELLDAFGEYISITKALSNATVEAYLSDVTQIEEHFKEDLIKVDSFEVLDFLAPIENKRTLNRKLSAINSFYDFCYDSEYIKNPIHHEQAKIPKNLPKFIEYDALMHMLSLIEIKTWLDKRDYALILFLYATGLRISEALNLHKDDFEQDWVRVRHAKGDKERLVPVAQSALDAIEDYRNSCKFNKNHIWLNYQGKPLSRISAFKITTKYIGFSPHVLRHSYATSLITGGADLRVVQDLLGHSSLLTTQVYTHIQKSELYPAVMNHHPLAKEVKWKNYYIH